MLGIEGEEVNGYFCEGEPSEGEGSHSDGLLDNNFSKLLRKYRFTDEFSLLRPDIFLNILNEIEIRE